MYWIKKNLYLCGVILFNLIVILLARYWYHIHHYPSFDSVFLIICMIAPRYILLPLDCFFISRKIYSTKKKWISVIGWIITFFSFLIVIDPWIAKILWEYSWLMRYEIFQILSNNIPFFFFLLWWTYIILCDILLRFVGNKIISYFTEKERK